MSVVEELLDTSSASGAWDTAKIYKNRAGYYFRQFSDRSHGGRQCRKMEHVLLYERVFGPIPHRCCVHHRDENPSNNSVENLMCIPVALHLELHARLRLAKQGLGILAYAVERQRITAEYEAKAQELILFWELIKG